MSDETTELQSLSKLKKAGKLRYWRGTIEIPENELHAICDEIQAEHDHAIAATLEEKPRDRTEEWLRNACNQAMQDYVTQLERERDEWKTKCESREFAYFAYKQADAERKRYSEQIDELRAERDEWKAKLADLSARAERTCHIIEYDEASYPVCSECDAVLLDDYTVYFCWNGGRKAVDE